MVVAADGLCRSRSPTAWTSRKPSSSPPSLWGGQPDPGVAPAASTAGWSIRRWSRWTGGLLVVMAISHGSCLTALAGSGCDVGVAYEMPVLVTRAGDVLTPASGPSSKPPCDPP
jgi:hypothetical protein